MVFGLEVRGLQGLYYGMCRSDGKVSVSQWKGAQIRSFNRFPERVELEIQKIGRGLLHSFFSKGISHHANAGFNIGGNLFPWPDAVRNKVFQGGKIPFTFVSHGSSIRTWGSIRTPIPLR